MRLINVVLTMFTNRRNVLFLLYIYLFVGVILFLGIKENNLGDLERFSKALIAFLFIWIPVSVASQKNSGLFTMMLGQGYSKPMLLKLLVLQSLVYSLVYYLSATALLEIGKLIAPPNLLIDIELSLMACFLVASVGVLFGLLSKSAIWAFALVYIIYTIDGLLNSFIPDSFGEFLPIHFAASFLSSGIPDDYIIWLVFLLYLIASNVLSYLSLIKMKF